MTILNQYEILKNVTPTWWIITLMALIVFIFIMTIIATESASRYALAVLSFAIIFTIVWGWVVKPIVTKEDIPTGRYRYECTIDDDASFIDIYEKYIVVERRGDLWVLEDRVDEQMKRTKIQHLIMVFVKIFIVLELKIIKISLDKLEKHVIIQTVRNTEQN